MVQVDMGKVAAFEMCVWRRTEKTSWVDKGCIFYCARFSLG